MPNYQNGKVYAIRSHQTDKIYIGSTIRSLAKRFYDHKASNKTHKKKCKSSEILQYEDAYIELLENYPCNSKEELLKKEGELIRSTDCVNRCIAGRTKREYYVDNKEEILKQAKEYHKVNRKVILQKMKEKYEKNKDKRKEKIT